jgi:hypothetical protein
MAKNANIYEGPVCFVGQPIESPFTGETLEPGWHYSTVVDDNGHEHPDKKLSLDPETGIYTFAMDGEPSWAEKTPPATLKIVAVGGAIGEPHDVESIEATKAHLDDKLKRLATHGAHDHEAGHILMTPDEISATKQWLDTLPAAGGAQ